MKRLSGPLATEAGSRGFQGRLSRRLVEPQAAWTRRRRVPRRCGAASLCMHEWRRKPASGVAPDAMGALR